MSNYALAFTLARFSPAFISI